MILKPKPTWTVLDSSKVQAYSRCERYVFFAHILGWSPESPSIHLVHGEAWHRGMEYILINGYTDESVETAMNLYRSYYRQFFNQTADEENYPKVPGYTEVAYFNYIDEYKDIDKKHDILYTEVAGSVLIGENDRKLHFRLDSIVMNNDYNKIESWEHKTGSRNSVSWRNDWVQKTQIGTYTHVLNCLYDPADVFGVRINGTFFYKSSDPVNVRVPIRKHPEQMQEWLWGVNQLCDAYERDLDRLSDCKKSDIIMQAFPKRTEACANWYGMCPFWEYCMANPNPLRNHEEPPPDFKVDFWDPRKRDLDATNVFDPDKNKIITKG